MKNIACVGEREVVFPFKALGLEIRPVNTGEEAREAIEHFIKEGYVLIILQEDFVDAVSDLMAETEKVPYPAIFPIPGSRGGKGIALEVLREKIKKAIGADIF
ncbi:MAG: hypothetical protein DRQ06_05585 [Candidatus Hydrothermota bacterium]|uniref:V-type ATP synthase subunit F n=1 Tax=candidate division WOR-3 bacterium TaxID=2052148 RepID=A0A7C1BGM1_UNCW3|nr:MAG: hypothetical protein DRQ06_05585 [Candidatus Hydrothermae bacterium]RKZ03385.1 MAG: hypothetical protein DRQ04_02440 [Candidatus Hydrothermae bacterium]HDM90728.1 hypothetical protein [candidate division WOR-3 bacterium]